MRKKSGLDDLLRGRPTRPRSVAEVDRCEVEIGDDRRSISIIESFVARIARECCGTFVETSESMLIDEVGGFARSSRASRRAIAHPSDSIPRRRSRGIFLERRGRDSTIAGYPRRHPMPADSLQCVACRQQSAARMRAQSSGDSIHRDHRAGPTTAARSTRRTAKKKGALFSAPFGDRPNRCADQ
jgi:hypothetical protein